jgi:hypothetical protein
MPYIMRFLLVVALLSSTTLAQGSGDDPSISTAQLRSFESTLAAVGMGETDASALAKNMADAGFSATQISQIGQQLQTATEERDTQHAMINKVQEGLAKKVGPEGIINAVVRVRERYATAMRIAKQIVKERPTAVGATIAEGMSSGLTQQDADKIANALQVRSQQMNQASQQALASQTMATSRDIVRMGVSSALTSEVVGEALAQGYDAASMELLRQTFNAQKNHSDMNQMARQLGLAVHQGVKAGDLGKSLGKGSHGSGTSSGGAGAGGSGGSGGGGPGAGGGSGAGGGRGGR